MSARAVDAVDAVRRPRPLSDGRSVVGVTFSLCLSGEVSTASTASTAGAIFTRKPCGRYERLADLDVPERIPRIHRRPV
jgi:hypothetical protein